MVSGETGLLKLSGSPSFSRLSPEMFRDVLLSLHRQGWSGTLAIDAGFGMQNICFTDGEIVFGRSNLMDHRLGEVIYRRGIISLQKLTDSAVQVTRSLKFGQVLLKDKTFSELDLWQALQQQVFEILNTLFKAPAVDIELNSEEDKFPTEVVFDEGTVAIVERAHLSSCTYHAFVNAIDLEATIALNNDAFVLHSITEGVFYYDIGTLISEHGNVQQILKASKLHEINTMAALIDMTVMGLCSPKYLRVGGVKNETLSMPAFLQSRMDVYSFFIKQVVGYFKTSKTEFPQNALISFVMDINKRYQTNLLLKSDFDLHEECIWWMYAQCRKDESRAQVFAHLMNALTRFLLQISGDLLPSAAVKELQAQFRQL